MNPVIAELAELLRDRMLVPFIGAGFSESCGCPNGPTLARLIAARLGLNGEDESGEPDLFRLAEYLHIIKEGDLTELIEFLRQALEVDIGDVSSSVPHLLLPGLDTPIIYTTNYDCLIEKGFAHLAVPFQTVVTTDDIIQAVASTAAQIVKFHGSLEAPQTLVLTESDYYERLEFITPLDIKLRADALGRSLLFIGYSFSDFNVRYLWFKIRRMTRGVEPVNLPRSYILIPAPDRITSTLLRSRGIIPIDILQFSGFSLSDKLEDFLTQLTAAYKKL